MNPTFKIALASVCALSSAATACSCMAPPAPKVALEQATAVFVGRVTKVEKSQYSNKFEFAVSKKWKGIKGQSASIVSADNSAACGIVFERERDYLVYAFKTDDDDQLQSNLCTRTALVADAAQDLAELGAPQTEPAPVATNYPIDKNGVVQIKADGAKQPLELLAQALQTDKESRFLRVSWGNKYAPKFYGTALYDRLKSTIKVYDHSHTLSLIPPQTVITSVLYSGVTPQKVRQLAANPSTAQMLRGLAGFSGIAPGMEKYGITARDLGSKRIND